MSKFNETADPLNGRTIHAQPVAIVPPGAPLQPSSRSSLAVIGETSREEEARPLVFIGERQPVVVGPDRVLRTPAGLPVGAGLARPRKIALVGDSITGAGAQSIPIDYPGVERGVFSKDLSKTNLNATSAGGNFVRNLYCNGWCSPTDSVTVEWDGVASMRSSVGGEAPGPWVNVTGGGFHHLPSGGGQKGVVAVIRWSPAGVRPGATVDTDVNGGDRRRGLLDFCGGVHGALMRRGYADLDLRNFGIGGNRPRDVFERIRQVQDFGPELSVLLIGINGYDESDEIFFVRETVKALNQAGSYVVLCTMLPSANGNPSAITAQQQADTVNQTLNLGRDPELRCEVVNLYSLLTNPYATSGSALVNQDFYGVDLVHVNIAACTTLLADALAPSFDRLIPGYRKSVAIASNSYHATHNPFGNLFGTAGVFAGLGGTAGNNPAATGTIGASWGTSAAIGTFASVVATAPQDPTSPIRRNDGFAGHWQRFVCTNASAGGASRSFFTNILSTDFAPGRRFRVRLTMRITQATLLTTCDVSFFVNNGTGGLAAKLQLAVDGNGADMVSGTLVDSGVLYLSSAELVVPPDVQTSGTRAYIQATLGCAQGGGFTLDMQDAVCEFVPA